MAQCVAGNIVNYGALQLVGVNTLLAPYYGTVVVVCLTSSRGWLSSRGINRKTVHQPPTPATS